MLFDAIHKYLHTVLICLSNIVSADSNQSMKKHSQKKKQWNVPISRKEQIKQYMNGRMLEAKAGVIEL